MHPKTEPMKEIFNATRAPKFQTTGDAKKPPAMQYLQVEFTPDMFARMNSLKARLDATNGHEVIKRALVVLDKLQTECEVGSAIYIRRADGTLVEIQLL